ncbi:hypothetical protein DdX_18954 [Ditylenchus destructor]|uniref:Uncharacterized protein n=1 Tax=Ditylenchus destructor TaxID=166010 RepID=A0AAD4MK01_9BILA|nr:hypothetical protein DdX_18954 [Ditylenchus destructor]
MAIKWTHKILYIVIISAIFTFPVQSAIFGFPNGLFSSQAGKTEPLWNDHAIHDWSYIHGSDHGKRILNTDESVSTISQPPSVVNSPDPKAANIFPPRNVYYEDNTEDDVPRTNLLIDAELPLRRRKRLTNWLKEKWEKLKTSDGKKNALLIAGALGLGWLGTWTYVSAVQNYNNNMFNGMPNYMPNYGGWPMINSHEVGLFSPGLSRGQENLLRRYTHLAGRGSVRPSPLE